MAFTKALDLIDLARRAASSQIGLSIKDVAALYDISERTAQRMLRALEQCFPNYEVRPDASREHRWRLLQDPTANLQAPTPEELATLDLARQLLQRDGQAAEAERLAALRGKVVSLLPARQVVRLETDEEALLEAQGLTLRVGPRPLPDAKLTAAIAQAVKSCTCLRIRYQAWWKAKSESKLLAPLAILTGLRRYLLAFAPDEKPYQPRLYRFETISEYEATEERFVRPEGFNLRDYAKRSFGTYQDEDEYGEVEWRFKPEAADHAASFQFHPDQEVTREPDGSLLVRFKAAGHLEMCWHLYAWGDAVEVVKPAALRRLRGRVHRQFPAYP